VSATNLLILVDGDFVGGAETNYRFILPGLIERGWSPIFVCPDDRNLRAYFDSLGLRITTETGMRPYPPFSIGGRASIANILKVFATIRINRKKVLRLIRNLDARAIVSNSMVSHLLNATLPSDSGFRRVIHLHDIVDRKKARGLYGRGLDWIGRRADSIVTISDAVIDTLPENARAKSVKLYNPVGKMPTRTRPPNQPFRVGMFARYTPWKGHMDFLDLAERFSDEPYEFVSYGNTSENDREYFGRLKSRANALPNADRVSLNGFTPDPMQEMANCDVVVHLSLSPEPFGRVLIEANACGVPILAYTGGGVEELFANLNLHGEKVAVGDIDGMEEALRRNRRVDLSQVRFDLLTPGRYVDSFLEVCSG
jgi:glycosyltransferase involved in cell wall biosynthesis